jgi:hypothetical protein
MTRDKRNTAIYTAFDDVDANDIPIPEKGLLRAILLNAIADMNRDDEHSRRARSYFLSKEDDYIFSFQAVCSYLNINPSNILVLVGLQDPPKGKRLKDAASASDEAAVQASLVEAAGRGDGTLT